MFLRKAVHDCPSVYMNYRAREISEYEGLTSQKTIERNQLFLFCFLLVAQIQSAGSLGEGWLLTHLPLTEQEHDQNIQQSGNLRGKTLQNIFCSCSVLLCKIPMHIIIILYINHNFTKRQIMIIIWFFQPIDLENIIDYNDLNDLLKISLPFEKMHIHFLVSQVSQEDWYHHFISSNPLQKKL